MVPSRSQRLVPVDPAGRIEPSVGSGAGTPSDTQGSPHRVDTSRFPLVVIELAANPAPGDNRDLADAMTRLTSRGDRCGLIVDMRMLNPLAVSALSRKEVAAAYSANLEARRRSIICEARIVESPLLRGIAVAFDWLVGRNWPSATFSDRVLAEEWVLAGISADATP